MNPTWTSDCGTVKLWNADCLDVLPMLKGVDLILTDPPYELRAGSGGGEFGTRDHLVKTGGFTDGGCDYAFLDRFKNWFCCCSLKQLPTLLAAASKRTRHHLLTWCKPNPVPTCCNKYLPDVEYIVHGFEKGRLFGEFDDKASFVVIPCGNKETEHPNEKPLPLIAKLVTLGSRSIDTICDPFMGSGTTGIACVKAGRAFLGIERDPHWFAVARDRISDELIKKTCNYKADPKKYPLLAMEGEL